MLAVSGSLRRSSHNTRAAAQQLPPGVEVYDALRQIPPSARLAAC